MDEPLFLITGAGGYLGRRLVARAASDGRVVAMVHTPPADGVPDGTVVVDITDADAVLESAERLEPTAIIHTAALNPGQGDESAMYRVNGEGSLHVAEAAAAVGAHLVAMSTDIVHDGTAGPYADDAVHTPINAYGRSKAAGEDAVLALGGLSTVVRTSLIYGVAEMDRGTKGFADRLMQGETVELFSDVMRNPIHVQDLAEALVRLALKKPPGLINVAGAQAMSREAFGRRMLRFWGVATAGMIEPVRASDVSDAIPLDVRLDSSRAEELLGMRFPGVDEVLGAG